MALRLKKNDKVVVLTGKDKGKTGKILRFSAGRERVVVEGVNIVKKHMRKRSENSPSGILEIPAPLHISNVALFCPNCRKGVRVGIKVLEGRTKIRVCKKCGSQL